MGVYKVADVIRTGDGYASRQVLSSAYLFAFDVRTVSRSDRGSIDVAVAALVEKSMTFDKSPMFQLYQKSSRSLADCIAYISSTQKSGTLRMVTKPSLRFILPIRAS